MCNYKEYTTNYNYTIIRITEYLQLHSIKNKQLITIA